ncbi:36336_t:CDS:1, partial [Racocetra persica]
SVNDNNIDSQHKAPSDNDIDSQHKEPSVNGSISQQDKQNQDKQSDSQHKEPSVNGFISQQDEQSEKIYYIVKLKKRLKNWEYLQSLSNLQIIIFIVASVLSLATGVWLLILEKNGMESKIRDTISTSVFGTKSIVTLLTSLVSLKNILSEKKINALDEIYKLYCNE